jgi:NADH:ubiquinone oxidoreductase subunit 4 (subunit M)
MPERWAGLSDVAQWLRVPLALLVAALLWMGFFPQTFVRILAPTFRTYFTAGQ